jgi:hypothetical protein
MSGPLKGLAAVLFAGAVLYSMQHTTPFYGEITSPIVVEGKAGERVDADDFALGIVNLHLARTLNTESFGQQRSYTTSGLWVVVQGAAEAKSESLTIMSAAWLGPNGVRYELSKRLSIMPGMLPDERLEPGLPKPVLMAFEVPENQAFDGTLIVARAAWMPLDEEVRIPLAGKPDKIHTVIRVGRGSGGVPWTLEAE